MPTVYKTAADRGKRNTRWMIAWTDELGRRRTRRAYADKLLSERLARQLEDDARARREGTIDAVAERMAAHARSPLDEHIKAYRLSLKAKGDTAEHIDLTIRRIEQAAASANWGTIAQIDAASLSQHVDLLRGKGRGHATINHHLRAVRGFTRWLVTNHRLAYDPLAGVKMLNTNTDRRRERRPLDDEELKALLIAAREHEAITIEKRYKRKVGPNKGEIRRGTRTHRIHRRDLLYLLAASTGLRFGEIKSLTPRSFDLKSDPPSVTVEAAYSKRRRRDAQPLRRDVADALKPLLDATRPGAPLWPKLPDEMGKVMAEDLKAAGIPVRDDAGRVVDFHALRHTFITRLARSGVTPKVAQALARHSTITLTMDRYAHVALADTSKALAALPAIAVSEKAHAEPAAHAAATGTDDAVPATTAPSPPNATRPNSGGVGADGADPRPLRLAESADEPAPKSQRRSQRAQTTPGRPASSDADATPAPQRTTATSQGRRKSRSTRDLGAPRQPVSSGVIAERASEADGTRTRNHRIDSPVL